MTVEYNKANIKSIIFRAPPVNEKDLSKFEKQLLDIVKEYGQISFNELITKIDDKYKPLPEKPTRWEATKYTWRFAKNMTNLLSPLKKLTSLGCIVVDNRSLEG